MLKKLFCALMMLSTSLFCGSVKSDKQRVASAESLSNQNQSVASLLAQDQIDSQLIQYESNKSINPFHRHKPKDYDKPFLSSLKAAKGKRKAKHNMAKIDFIYIITNKRCHRFDDLMRSFKKYNVTPYRFTSFGKKDLTSDLMFRTCVRGCRKFGQLTANKLVYTSGEFKFATRKMCSNESGYVNRGMSQRQLARSLSHISIIKDALDSGYENIWIMDSGTQLRCDPIILSQYISAANTEIPGWTTLYTDFGQRNLDDNIVPVNRFYFRPDFQFLDPDQYLSRAYEEEQGAYSENDNDFDKSSSSVVVAGVQAQALNACEQWKQNHPDSGSGDSGATGPSDQPGSNSSYNSDNSINSENSGDKDAYEQGQARARASFIIQNKRFAVTNNAASTNDSAFIRVGLLKGAHSYILNKKGMKLMLEWYLEHKIFVPFWQELQIVPGMEPYFISEPVTINQNPA